MSASVQPATGLGGWRVVVIALVAVLAIGIGAAAGAFLLDGRAGATAAAARYVPADSPFYLEWHVEPSITQDAALRELLGRFPAIDGIDLGQPLYAQLTEKLDEELAATEEGVSWADDVEPWFTGTVSMAVTSIPDELLSGEIDPMAEEPAAPGFVVVLGSDDADAAEAFLADARAQMDIEVSETTHAGVTLFEAADTDSAWAITDDAVLFAPHAADIRTALDTEAAGTGGVEGSEIDRLVAALPDDRLGFVVYDLTELMEASIDAAERQDPGTAAAMRSMLEGQSFRGALAFHVAGDRFAFDAATPNGTGDVAAANEARGLAERVPADALYYAEGANIGLALENVVTSLKSAAAADPTTAEQIGMAEAALGAELEELVSWIGDGAMTAGWDGTAPYAGLVIEPTDREAAQRRLDQLATFAGLAAMDPSAGITIDESEVAGTTVTTIRWTDTSGSLSAFGMPAGEVELQYAVGDTHVVVGVGDAFVGRVLQLGPSSSLASVARYTDAVTDLGGETNASVVWWDVAGTREVIEAGLGPMMGMMDPQGEYEATIQPWLLPLDRIASVGLVEDGLLIQRGALFVE